MAALSEVYEVKTGIGRQVLYTADLDKLLTHAAPQHGIDILKTLVLPADEAMAADIDQAVKALGINVRRFRLRKAGRGRVVNLDRANQR